jgi:stage II sporulation protein D
VDLVAMLCALALRLAPPAVAHDESEEIRILIAKGTGILRVSGDHLAIAPLEDADVPPPDGGSLPHEGPLSLACAKDHTVHVGPLSAEASAIEVSTSTTFGALGHTLRGRLVFRCDGLHWLAINVVPLEEYLAAVLGGEMPRTFPGEALKAQAVAARSYALTRKIAARDAGLPYHLGATVLSQVYAGVALEDPHTLAAVTATRGEVLANGVEPVEAYFHSSCGGKTESGGAALGRTLSYLEPVSCPCGGHSPYAHWSVTAKERDVLEAFGGRSVADISVMSRTSTGRARMVRVSSPSGTREISATVFREALGYQRLPSLWFDVHKSGSDFVFEGRGAGHGAGLCQWGAKYMADHGSSYRDILAHYYPGTDLQKIY